MVEGGGSLLKKGNRNRNRKVLSNSERGGEQCGRCQLGQGARQPIAS